MAAKKGTENKSNRKDKKGKFLPGNEFWKARSSFGRKKKFTARQLRTACDEYFQWCHDNPLWEKKVLASKGLLLETDVPKLRAMTIQGLCIFLEISSSTWANYREDAKLSPVVSYVEQVIRTQKFEGAAADLLNPNIIAREIGLRDGLNLDGSVDLNDMSDDQLDNKLSELLRKAGVDPAS